MQTRVKVLSQRTVERRFLGLVKRIRMTSRMSERREGKRRRRGRGVLAVHKGPNSLEGGRHRGTSLQKSPVESLQSREDDVKGMYG